MDTNKQEDTRDATDATDTIDTTYEQEKPVEVSFWNTYRQATLIFSWSN